MEWYCSSDCKVKKQQHIFLSADPLHLEITVFQLAERVSRLEEEVLPRLVQLESMFSQQQQMLASMMSPWNQQRSSMQQSFPYQQGGSTPQHVAHTGDNIQQSSCFTPQHAAYAGGHSQQSSAQYGVCSDGHFKTSSVTNASLPQNPPRCKQIQHRETTSYFPSASIDKAKLTTPEAVIAKYCHLRVESKVGMLAVKLAKEAFFGKDVLAQCTVSGFRDLRALPLNELNDLKQTLFQQFPNYWSSPEEFEAVWERVGEAIGQCAKGLRK